MSDDLLASFENVHATSWLSVMSKVTRLAGASKAGKFNALINILSEAIGAHFSYPSFSGSEGV